MTRLTDDRLGEIYSGTLTLVAEHGYDKLTMDQVAEATRSSKATLYRQWGGKAALVVDALRAQGDADEDLPDTGSLRGDLRAIAARKDHDEDETALITAILHAMKESPELAATVRAEIIDPARERIQAMLRRAVDRGEIASDNPALPFIDLMFMAPFVLSSLMDDKQLTSDYLHDYYEHAILPALGLV